MHCFFLVGCFSVKSLLDLQSWASRKNLWELWVVFIIAMIGHDIILFPSSRTFLGIKWSIFLIIVLFFYFKEIRFLVLDDKIALLAVVSLLHLYMISVFLILYTVLLLLLKRRIKHGFSHSKKIPTLPLSTSPVVFTVALFLFL